MDRWTPLVLALTALPAGAGVPGLLDPLDVTEACPALTHHGIDQGAAEVLSFCTSLTLLPQQGTPSEPKRFTLTWHASQAGFEELHVRLAAFEDPVYAGELLLGRDLVQRAEATGASPLELTVPWAGEGLELRVEAVHGAVLQEPARQAYAWAVV